MGEDWDDYQHLLSDTAFVLPLIFSSNPVELMCKINRLFLNWAFFIWRDIQFDGEKLQAADISLH